MRAEKFKLVSMLDEAIDTESWTLDEMIRYTETRDWSLIASHFFPNKNPTIYYVRRVPHSLWASYVKASGDNENEEFRRAFICGVERVDNLIGADGIALTSWTPSKRLPGGNIVVMSDEECNDRFFPADVEEIGAVIHKHSFLRPTTAATYPLRHSLVGPLAQRAFRRAEPSPNTASTMSSEERSDSPAPPPTEIPCNEGGA